MSSSTSLPSITLVLSFLWRPPPRETDLLCEEALIKRVSCVRLVDGSEWEGKPKKDRGGEGQPV